MDKLIITVTCDSSMSFPSNPHNPTRHGLDAVAAEYVLSVNSGAAICHLHGPYTVDEKMQADGTKLSDLDLPGWIYGSEVERLRDTSNWKGRTSGSCGGVIVDAGPHSFYLLKWLFGEIATVQATSTKLIEESEVEDHAIVTGRMKSGAIFSTEYTFTAEIPWGERLEVYGSTGSLIVDQLCKPPVTHFRGKTDTTGIPVEQVHYHPNTWKLTSIASGVRDFIEAIRDNRPPTVDPSDGYYALLIAERAYESIAQFGKALPV